MGVLRLRSFSEGKWSEGSGQFTPYYSAVNGDVVAEIGSGGKDFKVMVEYARTVGGPALRKFTFHERARMLKALAQALMAKKEELYELSYSTGATRVDSWIDIEGGAGTFFAYGSKGRRELPNDRVLIDGDPEALSTGGTFIGHHVYTSLQGVAVHINAFNFPVWGMLEKLAPTLLAGMPAIVKPASATAYMAEAAFRIMVEADVLPEGAVQFISGSTGDLFDHLTCQDAVSFTGSAHTSLKLRNHPVITRESVRFIAEQDSLNASILGPEVTPDAPEFGLFVKEVVKEMTVKAGQKCTAIRRALVPEGLMDDVEAAIKVRLGKTVVGDPRLENVRMGALVSRTQLDDVRSKIADLGSVSEIVFGDSDQLKIEGEGVDKGAFMSPVLLRANDPWQAHAVHEIEAFGPVSTLMPYKSLEDAVALANHGKGSLVMSAFTYDSSAAREMVLGTGAFHGRMVFINRDCAKESTGHGSPLPALVHGGPGRAGGGEEMGGIRGVKHYMQRTALQGSPEMLSSVVNSWLPGAPQPTGKTHPFRLPFGKLEVGYTLETASREVTLDDIEHFANFTGDTFYAHMDEEAAAANPFFPGRVAHGYLLLSFAAGLFVEPSPGPVLANYGLENLRFVKPVSPGDSISVKLTVKSKSPRNEEYGEVKWAVMILNKDSEVAATYELLTMNAM